MCLITCYLVLFSFQRSLRLLQGGLQLLLLHLKSPPLLVQIMDRPATITKLIKKVSNFIRKVLVLPLHNVELFGGLLQSTEYKVKDTMKRSVRNLPFKTCNL